jgi:hypothetical protein
LTLGNPSETGLQVETHTANRFTHLTDNPQRPGYTNVYPMDGGRTAWKESGQPIEGE